MSWVTASDVEGVPSVEVAFETEANQALRVTPPAGPPVAAGWNVFVGTASGEETKQNTSPLAPGEPWIMPGTGLVIGVAPGNGQEPDLYKTIPRFMQRG